MQALIKKTLTASATILLTLFVILFASLNNYFANRIAPNVKIGNLSLANKKVGDAQESIASELSVFANSPVTFYVEGVSFESDLQSLGIKVNEEETLEILKRLGKSPNAWKNIVFWLESPFVTRQISPQYSLDISKFTETTGAIFSEFETEYQDAAITFENGNIEYSGYYKNNLRNGRWRIFNEDGTLKYELNYIGCIAEENQMEKEASEFLDKLERTKGKIPDPEKTGTIR